MVNHLYYVTMISLYHAFIIYRCYGISILWQSIITTVYLIPSVVQLNPPPLPAAAAGHIYGYKELACARTHTRTGSLSLSIYLILSPSLK
jgi:hypothetical protein